MAAEDANDPLAVHVHNQRIVVVQQLTKLL